MATRKKHQKSALGAPVPSTTESQFTMVLEDLRSQFMVSGEALRGMGERMDREFVKVRGEIQEVRGGLQEVRGELQEVRGELQEVRGELQEVRGEVEQLKDAVRTHSKELTRVDAKLDARLGDHETRIAKLEGAAE